MIGGRSFENLKPFEIKGNKQSYFDRKKMYCTQSSYFKLNRSGKERLSQEENSVSFSLKNLLKHKILIARL